MQFAGRPLAVWAREATASRNYRALGRMLRLTPAPLRNAYRYFLARGSYPYAAAVRTPLGVVAPELHSFHDMMTFNEIFLREDYACPPDARVVVDVGSNIGVSALYFLTRNRDVRCWLHEPVPRNVEQLRRNLAGFEDRYELREAAVGREAGTVTFGVEATGRYGGIGVDTGATIEVPCVDISSVLGEVLARHERIDVLKVDIEGLEVEVIEAIPRDQLERIDRIYFEWQGDVTLHPDLFEQSYFNETYLLERRAGAPRD